MRLDHEMVLAMLPDRKIDGNKNDFGRILLLCGSRGYTGAAALAAMGALRSGAGLVYLGVPESIYAIEAIKLTEPVVFPLPDYGGMFSTTALPEIQLAMEKKDVVLIGPGIGRSAGTEAVVCFLLEVFKGPVILDADGINVLQAHKDILRDRPWTTILTPHMGEFKRFGGSCYSDRIAAAEDMARQYNIVLLLKGHHSIITDGKRTYINPTGNPGMAVGGSGDVLAGIIASLVGQGLPALEAAACGAWLHGEAGDICSREIGQYGMLPSDILQVLPRLLK